MAYLFIFFGTTWVARVLGCWVLLSLARLYLVAAEERVVAGCLAMVAAVAAATVVALSDRAVCSKRASVRPGRGAGSLIQRLTGLW